MISSKFDSHDFSEDYQYWSSAQVAEFERMKQPTKNCVVCGREIQWRKKWRDNWNRVKYCSRACRDHGLRDMDIMLEKVIMDLLNSSKAGATICPSQAARTLVEDGDDDRWRALLEPARRAARRLVHQGKISIMQGGKTVDPSNFKGPIRLKLKL